MKTNPNDFVFTEEKMTVRKDGGPEEIWHGGLTKREHFAGLALQGYMTTCEQIENYDVGWQNFIAKQCVILADALIDELNKRADGRPPALEPSRNI